MFHVKQKRVAFRSPAGACLLCRRLTLPLVYFSAPIPPTPFPRGEGGDFWFSYARGSAPCIPEVEPARHWLFSAASVLFFPPSPPTPFPAGRGDFCFILPGAGAPGTPAAEPGRHWLNRGAGAPGTPLLNLRGTGLPGGSAPAPLLLNPGGAGYAFGTQPHKYYRKHPRQCIFMKVLGGSGDSFKSPPTSPSPKK